MSSSNRCIHATSEFLPKNPAARVVSLRFKSSSTRSRASSDPTEELESESLGSSLLRVEGFLSLTWDVEVDFVKRPVHKPRIRGKGENGMPVV